MFFKYFLLTILGIFCFCLIVVGQTAQKSVLVSDLQWFQYYNQTKLSEKWMWSSDAGYRWRDGFKEKSQFLVRTGIGYNLSKTLTVNAGFALFKFYQDGETSRIEYRPYEDFVLNEKLGKVNLQHRLRFEQRFFKNVVNNKIQAETNFNYPFP